jgi:hypothetical protein
MKNWKLTLGIEHYYLDDTEANSIFEAKVKGFESIVLKSGFYISLKAIQSLIPIKVIQDTEKIDAGLYQCSKCNKWIENGNTCYCSLLKAKNETKKL